MEVVTRKENTLSSWNSHQSSARGNFYSLVVAWMHVESDVVPIRNFLLPKKIECLIDFLKRSNAAIRCTGNSETKKEKTKTKKKAKTKQPYDKELCNGTRKDTLWLTRPNREASAGVCVIVSKGVRLPSSTMKRFRFIHIWFSNSCSWASMVFWAYFLEFLGNWNFPSSDYNGLQYKYLKSKAKRIKVL